MNNDTQETMEMGTKPIEEHKWLDNLLGEWRVESEMATEPGAEKHKSSGTASVKSLGGLWAFSENKETAINGEEMLSYFSLGYDVSFKEYRGCWVGSVSSHLWNYTGELSADGKTMTLNCEGPSMTKDGETALYRDVHELIDENHRTLTSYAQDENGEWQEFITAHYYRA
jgi:hypothetical protein